MNRLLGCGSVNAFSTFSSASSVYYSSPLGPIVLSLFKLSAFYPAASILTTAEIKVVSTPNGAEIINSSTEEDEHDWVSFNKCFFTQWASESLCRSAHISRKRLQWIRAKCLFFQNWVFFCGNRGGPIILALFATKQEKTFLFKNYFMKLAHVKKLSALRTRQDIFLCLWIIRTT